MFGDYGLTTAHILYRLPDYLHILQSYVWQEYDFYPEYPHLRKFLIFWKKELNGPLYRVEVSHIGCGDRKFEFAKDIWKLP